MAAEPSSVTFETTVAVTGNNTGIVVPEEAIEQLAAGKRPPVLVNLNGYEYRNTVGVMGGKHMVSISAAVRRRHSSGSSRPGRLRRGARRRRPGQRVLWQAVQQHAAVSRRQHHRCQERRYQATSYR